MLRINGRGDTSAIGNIWEVIENEMSRQSKHLGYPMSTVARQLREINESDKERAVLFVLSNNRDKFCEYIGSCELTKQISIEGQWLMWDIISQKVASMDQPKIVSPPQSRDNNNMDTSAANKVKEEKTTPEDRAKKQKQMKALSSLFVSGLQCLLKKASHEYDGHENENGTNSKNIALKTTKSCLPEKSWSPVDKNCICNEKGRTYHVQLKPPALKLSFSATRTASPFSNPILYNNTRDKDDIFICV